MSAAAGAVPRKERTSVRLHPGVLFLTTLTAAGLLEYRFPAPLNLLFAVRMSIAGVLMAFSASILLWGVRTLHVANTPFEPNREPKAIVTSGPFRYSRNPMYLGLIIMGIGWAFLTSSSWFLAGTAALFLLLNFVVIPREEMALRRIFPTEFAEWSHRKRRWI